MTARNAPELLLLHALPLDETMWDGQKMLLPGRTHAPALYPFGRDIGTWADRALAPLQGNRVIVVGCSVGGSCALEVAVRIPQRVAALVLIGTKAAHRPDPALQARARTILREEGTDAAWQAFWQPLFSTKTPPDIVEKARRIALARRPEDLACGIDVFHTRPGRETFLASFQQPVIVVTGADDTAPGPQTSARQASLAPRGRFETVPDCGHYVPLERPDALNAILRGLIAACRT